MVHNHDPPIFLERQVYMDLSKTTYRLVTILLCIGFCICFLVRFSSGGETLSEPYDGVHTGESAEKVISIIGREPDMMTGKDLSYADSVMVYRDFPYLDMTGVMTYWMKDDNLVMSVFYPDCFDYRRDIELEYYDRFKNDFGTAELSTNGYSQSTVTNGFTVTSPVKTTVSTGEHITLVLRYNKRDAVFILSGVGVPNLIYLMDDIQEVLNEQ